MRTRGAGWLAGLAVLAGLAFGIPTQDGEVKAKLRTFVTDAVGSSSVEFGERI